MAILEFALETLPFLSFYVLMCMDFAMISSIYDRKIYGYM